MIIMFDDPFLFKKKLLLNYMAFVEQNGEILFS